MPSATIKDHQKTAAILCPAGTQMGVSEARMKRGEPLRFRDSVPIRVCFWLIKTFGIFFPDLSLFFPDKCLSSAGSFGFYLSNSLGYQPSISGPLPGCVPSAFLGIPRRLYGPGTATQRYHYALHIIPGFTREKTGKNLKFSEACRGFPRVRASGPVSRLSLRPPIRVVFASRIRYHSPGPPLRSCRSVLHFRPCLCKEAFCFLPLPL